MLADCKQIAYEWRSIVLQVRTPLAYFTGCDESLVKMRFLSAC